MAYIKPSRVIPLWVWKKFWVLNIICDSMWFKILSHLLNIRQSSLDLLKTSQNILHFVKAFRIASMLWKLLTALVLWTPVEFLRCCECLPQNLHALNVCWNILSALNVFHNNLYPLNACQNILSALNVFQNNLDPLNPYQNSVSSLNTFLTFNKTCSVFGET